MIPYHLLRNHEYKQHIVTIAKREVGVLEEPKNSNLGHRVEQYQRSVGEWCVGHAWCSCFVYWVCKTAANQFNAPTAVRKTGRALAHYYHAPGDNILWHEHDDYHFVQPGNLFIQAAKPHQLTGTRDRLISKAPGHIGIVTSEVDPKGFFHTVEGNTDASGSREGGGVYERTRHVSENIVGFVVPRLCL